MIRAGGIRTHGSGHWLAVRRALQGCLKPLGHGTVSQQHNTAPLAPMQAFPYSAATERCGQPVGHL